MHEEAPEIQISSPTATTLGSSAIVTVWEQNCFRTFRGFLGQIRLGLLKGSAEGSTMQGSTGVPLRFHESFSKVAHVSESL